MSLMHRSSAAAVALAASSLICAQAQAKPAVQVFSTGITEAEVTQMQKGWCDAVLAISAAYQNGGYDAARTKAAAVIDSAYAYDYGPVAFKPTYAIGDETFRTTRDGALAYFVGPDPTIPEFRNKKLGFATYRHWVKCEIKDYVVQLLGNTANTMGMVILTDSQGQTAEPEKTWTFLRQIDGSVRIVLHHSSAPFDAR
ncbi:hypothetical protein MITS9509_02391 [Synechococcus sp. MIT S9509]|nr:MULTISPECIES: hypothetical protein [unclassified Synechococcus]KZR85304.1 hypothetical protein MITS9504_02210 [Synechococcus sp. MIT S9504]KZR91455.1 hypothetical protein MITS9509_02391 [Synechococcus sp. MIT S9509]